MIFGFATLGLKFDGDSLHRGGLGGSETAMIYLTRELAARGHEVHVFCFTASPGLTFSGVHYHDIHELGDFNARQAFDVFVCSRFWEILSKPIDAKLIVAWCHDMLTNPNDLLRVMWQVDKVVCLSNFQKIDYVRQAPALEPLIWTSSNGVDMDTIRASRRHPFPKERGKLIYTSRPERGLIYLLRDIFPRMLKERPDLRLHVCSYDTPGLPIAPEVQAIHEECEQLMDKLGRVRLVRLGSLNKADLYREISTADLWLYPTDFPEISCISAMEAQACGTRVITTNDFALCETVRPESGVLVPGRPTEQAYIDLFVKAALANLGQDAPDGTKYIEQTGYEWKRIAEMWEWMAARNTRIYRPERIACCMIVKNEEADLYRCLRHVKPFVDELHVIDTGSSDATIEIAQAAGANVRQIEFDNFAQARNESIRDVKADWILWIDADEVLVGGQHLRKYLRGSYFNGFAIRQRHLILDTPGSEDTPVRLFRNKPYYRFTGMVHEHAEDLSKGPFDCQIDPVYRLEDVQIAHYGYIAEPLRREKVSNRNMQLLRRSMLQEPQRQLTWALGMRDLLSVARWHFEKHGSIEIGSEPHQMLQSLVELYLSRFADESHRYHRMAYPIYQEALAMMNALGLPCSGRLNAPIEIAVGMLGSACPGGLPQGKTIEHLPRWYPDLQTFVKFVEACTNKLMQSLDLRAIVSEPTVVAKSPPELLAGGQCVIPHQYLKDGRPVVGVPKS